MNGLSSIIGTWGLEVTQKFQAENSKVNRLAHPFNYSPITTHRLSSISLVSFRIACLLAHNWNILAFE